MRVGIGYDVHAFEDGRELILGGVRIPTERGLAGHSDADVLVHAIMDALLGAAKLGDIGLLFPDTDDTYKGADSMDLLQEVGLKLEEAMYVVENIDATVVMQAPKLRPFIPMMEANIAMTLGIEASQVSIKATTEEHLGFTGRSEGVKAVAVCAIESLTRLMEDSMFEESGGSCSGGCRGCSGCGSM
ncbi:MAG: 2-C-methyl-D-erythritol 2,4-cyclodiphosphate synthase [Lachnospiraceae bacterium]|nr:2-C-methyl-D-erythritol 2,4-cyclodiphosphate synthase [Lachnospiraceae bacterium]MDY5742215.1 2-C-methyl-D-erythritol 2,4-cyclodiphosphate synthase [Lachnospiraceae bacterium]